MPLWSLQFQGRMFIDEWCLKQPHCAGGVIVSIWQLGALTLESVGSQTGRGFEPTSGELQSVWIGRVVLLRSSLEPLATNQSKQACCPLEIELTQGQQVRNRPGLNSRVRETALQTSCSSTSHHVCDRTPLPCLGTPTFAFFMPRCRDWFITVIATRGVSVGLRSCLVTS